MDGWRKKMRWNENDGMDEMANEME